MSLGVFEALVVGIVQGLTEFIPVSSSGHLVVVPWLLGWPEPGLAFDTMVHLGTLMAVLVFFAKDYVALLLAWLGSIRDRSLVDEDARLAWLLIIATVPAILAGVFLDELFEKMFSSPGLVGIFMIVTAGLLLLAERFAHQDRDMGGLNKWMALFIGCAQALAIAPGISRSGTTIAAGLGVGMDRPAAARFSFLMSTPVILGAAASQVLPLVKIGGLGDLISVLATGFVAAAVVGYFCIGFMLRFLRGKGLQVFAIYCVVMGLTTVLLASIR